MPSAKLPESAIDKPERTILDMNIGETAYVLADNFLVEENRDASLRGISTLLDGGPHRVQVERRDDGFHVILIARYLKWVPNRLKGEVPVLTIEEKYEAEFDQSPIDQLAASLNKPTDSR